MLRFFKPLVDIISPSTTSDKFIRDIVKLAMKIHMKNQYDKKNDPQDYLTTDPYILQLTNTGDSLLLQKALENLINHHIGLDLLLKCNHKMLEKISIMIAHACAQHLDQDPVKVQTKLQEFAIPSVSNISINLTSFNLTSDSPLTGALLNCRIAMNQARMGPARAKDNTRLHQLPPDLYRELCKFSIR